MLKKLITNNIQLVDSIEGWEDAIKLSAQPLIVNKNIENRYIDAMIKAVYEHGPYIVLTNGVAMPHARPQDGVIKEGISFLKVKNGVGFYKTENKVYLFITLAATTSNKHQNIIAGLASFLDNQERIKKLIEDDLSEKEILDLF